MAESDDKARGGIECAECGYTEPLPIADAATWWWCRTCAQVVCAKCNLLARHTEHRSVQWSPAQCIASLLLALENRCRTRTTQCGKERQRMQYTMEMAKRALDNHIDTQLEGANERDRFAIASLKRLGDADELDHVYNVRVSPLMLGQDGDACHADPKHFSNLVDACARLAVCSPPVDKEQAKVLDKLAAAADDDASKEVAGIPEAMTPIAAAQCILDWRPSPSSDGGRPSAAGAHHPFSTPIDSERSYEQRCFNNADSSNEEDKDLKVRLARLYERPLRVGGARSTSHSQSPILSRPADLPTMPWVLRRQDRLNSNSPVRSPSSGTMVVQRGAPQVDRSQSSQLVTAVPKADVNGNDATDQADGAGRPALNGNVPLAWEEFTLMKAQPQATFEHNNNNMVDTAQHDTNRSANASEVFYSGAGPYYDRLSSSSRMSTRTDGTSTIVAGGPRCNVAAYEFGSDFLHRPVDVCALPKGALAVSDANNGVEVVSAASGERLLHLDTAGRSASALAFAAQPRLLYVSLLDRKSRCVESYEIARQFAKGESIACPTEPKIGVERARWIATTDKGELFMASGDDKRSAVWRYSPLKQRWNVVKTERNVRYQYLKVVEENQANRTIVLLTVECNNGKLLLLVTPNDPNSVTVCQEYDLSAAYGLSECGLRSPTAAVVDASGTLLAGDWRTGKIMAVRRRTKQDESSGGSGRSAQTLAQLGARNCLGMTIGGDNGQWLFVACMLRRSVYAIKCSGLHETPL